MGVQSGTPVFTPTPNPIVQIGGNAVWCITRGESPTIWWDDTGADTGYWPLAPGDQ